MKRILYAWELGGGLGHINVFMPIARALEESGCELTWALAESRHATVLLEGREGQIVEAPKFREKVAGLPEPQLSFSEILLRAGYLTGDMLTPLVRGWRDIIERAQPDLVITDHAPTALLAARSLKKTCVRIGNGFCCPPPIEPEPPLMPWLMLPAPERSADSRRIVLSSVNAALASHGAATLPVQALMHLADDDIVTTYPDLDHYPHRGTPHWGAVLGGYEGEGPVWPREGRTKVFFYMRASQAQALPVLRALRARDCSVLAYCPGLTREAHAELQGPNMRFAERPVQIKAAIAECALVVCGGGHGTVCAALLGGKPLLVAPDVTEQGITAHKVTALGAGLMLLIGEEKKSGALADRLIGEPAFTRAAEAFRQNYNLVTETQTVEAIAARCLQLSGKPTRAGL